MGKYNLPVTALIIACLLSAACRHAQLPNDKKLTEALQLAGDNKGELQKVFDHYSAPQDSLKFKAAIFLVKYMPGKFGKVFTDYDNYKPVFDTLQTLNAAYDARAVKHNFEFYKYYKSTVFNYFMAKHRIAPTTGLNYEVKEDIKTITADYLIENIDYAFKAWDMPWNKKLHFNDFCEYILPYRYGNEELTPWRKEYYESNKYLLDRFKNEPDPVKVCMFLRAQHDTTRSEISELKGLDNALRPLDLIRINSTISCKDESGVTMLRLRGLGLPVTRFTIPSWGNWGSGHDVNGLLVAGNKWVPFAGGTDEKPYIPPTIFTTAKVFAELYSDNKNSSFVKGQNEAYAINPNYIDVTQYLAKTTDLTIPFTKADGTPAYLCVFNNDKWVPVMRSTINNGRAVFMQTGKGVIYTATTVDAGELELKDNPFLLDSNGMVNPIIPSNKKVNITLFRKYPPNELINSFIPTLNGCYFQGSNDSTFANAITLWKIDKVTGLHSLEKQLKNIKYQYVRLVFPDIERKNEELGGIQIYGDNKQLLTGEPISSTKGSKTLYTNVFDNNPFTFVRLLARKYADFEQFLDGESLVIPDKHAFWVGLKLKDKMNITAIGFSPRTDDNDVNTDEIYKLFYRDNGVWVSPEMKRGVNNKVEFNVPANALYVLKDMTKGKEQRIFLYKDNKQIWY